MVLATRRAATMNPMTGTPVIQKEENRTGMPDSLKSGVENLSGQSLDDVQVHYNSPKPAELQAVLTTAGRVDQSNKRSRFSARRFGDTAKNTGLK